MTMEQAKKNKIKWVITQTLNLPADVGKSRQGIKSQLCSHNTLIRKTHPLMECADIKKVTSDHAFTHAINKPFSKLTSYSWQWNEVSTEKERKHWSHPHHTIKLTSYNIYELVME